MSGTGPDRVRIFPGLALALALAACAGGPFDEEIPEHEGALEADGGPVHAFSEEVRAAFEPGPAVRGAVSGTLRLLVPLESSGKDQAPRLHLRVSGLEPGPHAWHFHSAPCGEEGEAVVPLAATRKMKGIAGSLEADGEGRAHAEVEVPLLERVWTREGAYSIHVHRDRGSDHGPTVACATL